MKRKTKAFLAGSLLVGGIAIGTNPAILDEAQARPLHSTQVIQQRSTQVQNERGTFAKLAKELKPSVVNITVVKNVAGPSSLFSRSDKGSQQLSGQGSGVIVTSDGDILTNNHVIEGASEILVKLFDGREVEADVVGTDPNTDLALLRLNDTGNLPVAKLGDSDALEVGDWVMAIGNPFGLEATVTVGVLSGKGRVIGAGPYDDFLQTDTSINPGNSGGPLFNLAGEVVGINTAIIRQGQGIGFSIPINMAKDVSKELKAKGKVERGFLGVGVQELTPGLKRALNIPKDSRGALISSLVAQGPAAEADLKVSDLIVKLNGQEISSQSDLLRKVAKLPPSSKARVTVLRDGSRLTKTVTLTERPAKRVSQTKPQDAPDQQYRVGVAVADRTDGRGVLVHQVVPGSKAAQAKLRPGDFILAVGNQQVKDSEHFQSLVKDSPEDLELALLVERRGRTSFVLIE